MGDPRARAQREEVEALARRAGAAPVEGFAPAWIAGAGSRLALFFRGRRPGVVIRAGDELLVVHRRRRRAPDLDDVAARLPFDAATVRARRLGLLHQVLVEVPASPEGPRSFHALEFPGRSRRFARALAAAP